jgi:cellulose synthase (UDP-forming)
MRAISEKRVNPLERITMNAEKEKIINLNPPLLPLFSTTAIIYFVYYLIWRALNSLNPRYPLFSWMLLGAEAFGVLSYLLFTWFTRDINPMAPYRKPKKGIKVDIFIPTYNEDLDIVEATVIGCCKVSYPHTTYVLDDGDRPQVREMARQYGCEYIARPVHQHAKAGNINYALERSSGEFIVMLDADMVPQPEYLDRTLGYFEDEKLALIQLPQEFYNQDSIQHAANKTAWHEQSLFFRVIQPGKNHTNSAFWCGSPSVVRRRALEDVGGVATETVTEDIHTSVRMHSRGWKTLFVNEPLAFGIAPQTIKAFLVQRLRWAQGTMQLYRSRECPLWIKGLSFEQRLSYLSSFLAYFEAIQKLILILTPVVILGFDIFPMSVEFIPFMLRWVPYFALNIIANQMGGRGVFNYLKTEKYNLLKSIVFIQGTFTLFINKPLKFNVTPKTIDDSVYRQERQQMRSFMVIMAVISASMAFALGKIFVQASLRVPPSSFAVALVWSLYNVFIIFLAIREVNRKRHERKKYRFAVAAYGKVIEAGTGDILLDSRVINLSITGAGLLADETLAGGSRPLMLHIEPEKFDFMTVPIERYINRPAALSGKFNIGIAFTSGLGTHRSRLFEYLFIHLPKADALSLYHIVTWDPFEVFRKKPAQPKDGNP